MDIKTIISEKAMQLVMDYECARGRVPFAMHKKGVGYDIYSKNDHEERFIEVKGSAESWTTHFWQPLYYTEVNCLKENPEKFYLYMVHCGENNQQLYVIPGTELLSHFQLKAETFRLSPISRKKLKPYLTEEKWA